MAGGHLPTAANAGSASRAPGLGSVVHELAVPQSFLHRTDLVHLLDGARPRPGKERLRRTHATSLHAMAPLTLATPRRRAHADLLLADLDVRPCHRHSFIGCAPGKRVQRGAVLSCDALWHGVHRRLPISSCLIPTGLGSASQSDALAPKVGDDVFVIPTTMDEPSHDGWLYC